MRNGRPARGARSQVQESGRSADQWTRVHPIDGKGGRNVALSFLGGAKGRGRATATDDPVVAELTERLTSLHDHCLTNIAAGMRAMQAGDLTVAVTPVTSPIASQSENPALQRLVDLFNSMLEKAQATLETYNDVRETQRRAL